MLDTFCNKLRSMWSPLLSQPLKKIAVQFFGHLRTFERTFESFKKNVVDANERDGYEVDIFVHTWDDIDHSTVNGRNPEGICLTDRNLCEVDIRNFKKMYTPKEMLVEKQLEYEEKMIFQKMGKKGAKRSITGNYNMSYTLYKGTKIRNKYEEENNIVYDWVIVTRPDVLFKCEFRLEDILAAYKEYKIDYPENALYFAYNPFCIGKVQEPRFLVQSDLIYFARPKNVNMATSLFENFRDNIDIDNYYLTEGWWRDFWEKVGLLGYPILYRYGHEFDVVRLEKETR